MAGEVYFQGNGSLKLQKPTSSVVGSVGDIGSVQDLEQGGGVVAPGQPAGPTFKDTVSAYMNRVNSLQSTAHNFAKRLASGEELDLHRVMIASEQATMALNMTIQLRNKMVEAYQEILRMQV